MTNLMPSTIQYFSLITGLIFAILLSIMYLELNWLAIPAQVQRFGCIDGLRGYLALGVFYHHFFMWTSTFKYGKWIDPDVILFNNLGEATVACFFMITGALFYPKINKGFENTDWSRLYISRVFRILPLAWLAILAVFIVVFVKGWPSLDFSIPKMIKSIVLWFSFLLEPDIAGFHNSRRIIAGVTWSLRYEWLFYLSLPLMAILFTRFQKFVSNLTIILFLMVISLVMFSTFPKVAMKVATFIPLFLFGMLAAELSTMPRLVVVMRSVTASILGLIAVFFEIFRFSGSYGIVQYFLLSVFLFLLLREIVILGS